MYIYIYIYNIHFLSTIISLNPSNADKSKQKNQGLKMHFLDSIVFYKKNMHFEKVSKGICTPLGGSSTQKNVHVLPQ